MDAEQRAEQVVRVLRFRLAGWRGQRVVDDVQWRKPVVILTLTVGEAETFAHCLTRGGL